ncbi:hypothetical protein Cob_v010456 [Colletotrichum orbiculare MAFF 240422]|uniref:Uncharacterized protein n=1 Tax=Colletotrichum orbiculare (strain 104-T / ATCC 96160 / CBS 514.97 / LARS 414 / MAFF 240422) TaxID=1213857 RepID=A0A484FEV0_COLOR|nr:hypothetical protein Cob_v010456 [Colletotrichum orbiculare MAFF 240422]
MTAAAGRQWHLGRLPTAIRWHSILRRLQEAIHAENRTGKTHYLLQTDQESPARPAQAMPRMQSFKEQMQSCAALCSLRQERPPLRLH